MMAIPDRLRQAALWPDTDLFDPPPEHPFELIRRDGFTVGVFPGVSFGSVSPRALAADAIERTLDEARLLLSEHGKVQGAWFVPEATFPIGLGERLRGLGMVPYDEPPLEPRFAAMLALEPPQPAPPGLEARPARSFEEFQAGMRVGDDAFDVSEEDRRAVETHERLLWELELSGRSPVRSFVAVIDEEIVGTAGAIFGANTVFLTGGSTRADARGRGVYRALVRARWDAASQRGTPALTVSAGRMSRPILERLGFITVGWADCLLDRFSDASPASSAGEHS